MTVTDAQEARRVLLAITETCAVEKLWQSLVENVVVAEAEVVTVFVSDDVWNRAASLPFTREISRISGTQAVFTRRRAEQIGRDAASRARQQLEQLAAGTGLQLAFEILSLQEAAKARQLTAIERDLLIAPSVLEHLPIFSELAGRHRRVLLVEAEEPEDQR
jgi:hypothetical protein